jgi:hypothetical protein
MYKALCSVVPLLTHRKAEWSDGYQRLERVGRKKGWGEVNQHV